MPRPWRSCAVYLSALSRLALLAPAATAYTPDVRWGQSTTLVGNTLYVYGGKSDPSNMYSYSSAPNTNDLISLDLSSTFALTDVPWTYVTGSDVSSSSQGPTVTFHSLTPFNATSMLLFGGDGGPSMALPATADSAWLLDISSPGAPSWIQEQQGWANEPVRVMHHSAVGSFGRVWITGGEKADGSMLPASGHYVFQPSVPSFDQLPVDNAPPIVSGHASVLLPSGILLVFGGYNPTTGAMLDMSNVWTVDTSQAVPAWSNITVGGTVPAARHGFAYTTLGNGRVFIHGGVDAGTQTVYSDAAILDTTQNPMQWSALDGFGQIGARRDHMAVGVGEQVLIGFGYGSSGPAPSSLSLFEVNDGSWASSFVPVPAPTPSPSIPLPPATNPGSPSPVMPTNPSQSTDSASMPHLTTAPSSSLKPPIPGPVPTDSHTGPHNTHGATSSNSAPSSTSTLPPGSQDTPSSNIKKIAIGAVVAVIALIGLVLCGAYMALRRRRPIWKRGDGSARLIGPEPERTASDEGYGGQAEKNLPSAASNWGSYQSPRRQWTLLGLGTRQNHGRQRFDILHDEDAREFGDVGTGRGAAGREASEISNRTAWGDFVNASSASLRSVGAALGLGRAGRQSSYGSVQPSRRELEDMEKNASNPFLDNSGTEGSPSVPTVALVGTSRPRAERQESSSSLREVTYRDPFEDPSHYPLMPLEENHHGRARSPQEGESLVGAFRQEDLEDHGCYDDTIIPPTLETYGLTALGRPRSNSDLAPSNESVGSGNGAGSATASISHDYHPITLLSNQPSAPIRRSDSWWSRFSVGSLRGDRGAHQEGFNIVRRLSRQSERPSRADAFIDFRDPNPPPPLRTMAPIRETGHSAEPSPDDVQRHSRSSTLNHIATGSHRRSASSLVTVQTADSSALERIGQMDIIQRVRTASSLHRQSLSLETSPELSEERGTSGFVPRRPRLSIVPGSPVGGSRSAAETHQESRASTPSLSEDHGTVVASPTELSSSIGHSHHSLSPVKATTPVRTRQPTGRVAERIAAYERRMTETSPITPTRKSPVGGEPIRPRTKSHTRVEYGLVQRPELFVANPDGRASPPP
ncbi:kelch repeat-containing protein 3 [Ceratobasidium sp. AG-Ba]|nr:kelch repeat-containing protein 3 [Ceratobasidium sp. AG-Ba]